MRKGDKLFVRIDYEVEDSKTNSEDFSDHIKYVTEVASERYLVGGGFSNVIGGMIIYEAKDLQEAKAIANNDPLIKRNLYRCDVCEWDLVVVSNENKKK